MARISVFLTQFPIKNNDLLTERHEDVIDRPSNDTRGPQRQDKSRLPSWGPLKIVRVIKIEAFLRSGPNRAAAFSTVPWLPKAVEDWGLRSRLTQNCCRKLRWFDLASTLNLAKDRGSYPS